MSLALILTAVVVVAAGVLLVVCTKFEFESSHALIKRLMQAIDNAVFFILYSLIINIGGRIINNYKIKCKYK
ncbi:hypothetical protein FMO003_14000 [Moritella sp. F3]|nr:hypothetical protein FMO003_14000 [Moritella sp. F3]